MRQTKIIYPSNHPGEDSIKELCEKPDFIKAIEGIRNKWKIDVSVEIGYLQEAMEYFKHKNDYDVPIDTYLSGIEKESNSRTNLLKNKKFIVDVKKIQKDFGLGEEWSSFIEEYVFMDIFIYSKSSSLFIEKRTGKEGDVITGKPAYYLRIFPETTQEDVAKSWSEINKFINGKEIKNKRRKPSKKYNGGREIYELAKCGIVIEDIQKHIKDKYKKDLTYNAIIATESRYRKKMGIKEGNKLRYRKGGEAPFPLQKLRMMWSDF